MRASISRSLLSFALLSIASACGDAGNGSAGQTTTAPGTTGGAGSTGGGTTAEATTEPGTGSTGGTTAPVTSSAGSTGTTAPDTGSTTADPNCPPVKGEYNDCLDDENKIDNTKCNWKGDGDHGFITCLLSGPLPGASACSIVNCSLDCHCFAQPATGTAKSVCKPMVTVRGDNACLLDCSGGATCPDGMVCDKDTCYWPAP